MSYCLSKDCNDENCRNHSIKTTLFCRSHQYMNEYTDEMINNTRKCSGCKKHKYFIDDSKTCQSCKDRKKENNKKKSQEKILCGKKDCKYKKSQENKYCKLHQRCLFEDKVKSLNKKCCKNVVRGCHSILDIDYKFSKCENCLEKDRIKDKERREKNQI